MNLANEIDRLLLVSSLLKHRSLGWFAPGCLLCADFVAKVGCDRWMLVGRFTNGDRLFRRLPGALYATLTLRNTRRMSGWRSRNQRREPPQVLGDGSKDKLVLGTSRSTQSKPTELQDAL